MNAILSESKAARRKAVSISPGASQEAIPWQTEMVSLVGRTFAWLWIMRTPSSRSRMDLGRIEICSEFN
jgi:hypothetical protein